ncbi:MAG: NAD(P)H-dependent oxidoreductase [Abitibacteriaceae bacterium]|nr:NAD(P)H-dependent oxidoreductase [Abditibacteriaceae bacterium]
MPQRDLSHIVVAGLCGSLSAGGSTQRVLEVALSGAQEAGAQTAFLDLRDYQLPFAGQVKDPKTFPDVVRLSDELRAAHAIIWATPEYHGSYSGVLKNALDLMGFDEFEGKMIGLIGIAGGALGAIHSLDHLRSVGRQLHAWVLPQQVSIARAWDAFNADGTLKDKELETRLKSIGHEITRFALLHSTTAQDFLERWEKAAENPGGDQ